MSGQSIMDRMTAAKHSIAGQGLAKTVCKATTEEVMGPKKKHLDYLLQCTNEPNVSIPQLADLLIERTQSGNWVIVFKSLVTTQNLMNYGNERFTQYLASNNCTFNLGSFVDKTGVQGYDMSTFIRRYSKYLNEKAYSYRTMAFDFCKVKRGRDDGLLRTMSSEKLLKALPVLQGQIDALLEFDCTPNELTNGVINACFMLMFKDLIRLFACYNDGIINLLEKYFDMNKKQCKEALDIYKKFLVRMDKVSEFLKVAESVGIDKGDIPDLAKGLKDNTTQAPASLLDALEQHLQSLEGKKGTTPTTTTAKPAGYTTAVNSISGNSAIQISEEEKKRILDEENNRLQQLKFGVSFEQKLKDSPSSAAAAAAAAPPSQSNNPFATSPTATNAAPTASPATVKPSQDLLNLTGNPFVENVQSVMNMNSATNAMQGQNAFGAPAWGQPATGGFGTDTNFATAFSSSNNSGSFDAFGEVLTPHNNIPTNTEQMSAEMMQPQDLDSSLANLAGNLGINGANSVKKNQHQWQPKTDAKKTGGNNWSPIPVQSATWSQGFSPQPAQMGMMYGAGGMPAMGGQPMMNQMGQPMGPGMMAPGMGMPMGGGMGMPMGQQGMYQGMRPGMQPMGGMPRPNPPASQPNDPFGAL